MALSTRDKEELRELRSHGNQVTAQEWQRFTRAQQQEILRQSRKITREASQTPEQRRRNARRRADRYTKKTPEQRRMDWPQDEGPEFWMQFVRGDSGALVELQ